MARSFTRNPRRILVKIVVPHADALHRRGAAHRLRHRLEDRAGLGAVRRRPRPRLSDGAGADRVRRRHGLRHLLCRRASSSRSANAWRSSRWPAAIRIRRRPPNDRLRHIPCSRRAAHRRTTTRGPGRFWCSCTASAATAPTGATSSPAFAKHFHAVAWDARGYGGSDDYDGPLDFGDFSADLLRVLDHLGARKAHLVGLSMGGRIIHGFLGPPSRARRDADDLRLPSRLQRPAAGKAPGVPAPAPGAAARGQGHQGHRASRREDADRQVGAAGDLPAPRRQHDGAAQALLPQVARRDDHLWPSCRISPRSGCRRMWWSATRTR